MCCGSMVIHDLFLTERAMVCSADADERKQNQLVQISSLNGCTYSLKGSRNKQKGVTSLLL
jgi:hypothetical protein